MQKTFKKSDIKRTAEHVGTRKRPDDGKAGQHNSADAEQTEKNDAYAEIAKAANKKIKQAQLVFPKLTRNDLKKPIVAKAYASTHDSTYRELRERFPQMMELDPKTQKMTKNPEAFSLIEETINEKLVAVKKVERYMLQVVEHLHEHNNSLTSIVVKMPHEIKFKINLMEESEKEAETILVEYKSAMQNEEARLHIATMPLSEKLSLTSAARSLTANFIQSLDALILSEVQDELYNRKIRFLAKHDAYLIKAEHAETLKQIAREKFHAIFSQPLLAMLTDNLNEMYKADIPHFNDYSTYDIDEVLQAKFILA